MKPSLLGDLGKGRIEQARLVLWLIGNHFSNKNIIGGLGRSNHKRGSIKPMVCLACATNLSDEGPYIKFVGPGQ